MPSTNLVTPNPQDAFSGTGYISSVTHVKSKSAGAYFIDTVKFDRFIELSGGVRWDYFNTLFNLYAPPTSLPGAKPTRADSVHRSNSAAAELSRGACLQAEHAWQRLLRLWHQLQPFG